MGFNSRFGVLDTKDLDRLIRGVEKLPEALRGGFYDRALEKGGETILEYMRGSLWEKGLIDTWQLFDSIKAKRLTPTSVGVTPTGVRTRSYKKMTFMTRGGRYRTGKPVRNAEVGFILEYGTSSRDGKKWISEAADAASDDVAEAALAILEEVVRGTVDGI